MTTRSRLRLPGSRTVGGTALALVLGFVTAAVPVAGQDRERRAPQTDQTVPVARGARLSINNLAGEVVITTWDRDSLRVQARHSPRHRVDIQNTSATVSIRARTSGPGSPSVDYEITAPRWLPIKVDGTYNFVSIEGAESEITAETVRGDIVVKGGTGFVTAKSIEGEVIVEGAKGRIHASSVNEGIRITGATGDVVAETTNGGIVLTAVDARSLDVTTVNGDIRYEGSIGATGRYRFTSHNGDLTLTLPDSTSATFSVRTYNGEFSTNLPLKGAGEARRGRRVIYTLGGGGAEVELETFQGTIRVRRPGPASTGRSKDKENKEKDTNEARLSS